MTHTVRPNPDLLLAEVQRSAVKQQRGKLKVFFGMAAGVGKTYAMLEEARRRAEEGMDVLVGYAEPHIRPETEAMLIGMDVLPYKVIEYRGAKLKEFDLDAALAKKPSLILIDELAHSNTGGMRHPKRWQDVAELLDVGINVYTTLNVQHLESANDLVERVTGVRVRETLPDSVLEQADEVELVDIAPEELLERFREGKVYRPEQAERAAKHFFTRGNLIALRELALRRTAERVDAQMHDFRREHAVGRILPTSERILVCIGPSPLSARLVRSAKRLATALRAPWAAVFVQTHVGLSEQDRRRVDQHLRLAEQLGGQAITLSGENVADEITAYARLHNVTKFVIGKPQRTRWREALFGSVVDDLIRSSGEIDVYVIRGDAEEAEASAAAPAAPPQPHDWRGYAWAVLTVAAATAIGWPVNHHLNIANSNILMLYLLGVLWVAGRYSRGAATLAALLSVAAFDFCFVPPYLTFAVTDQQYLFTFAVMLGTAIMIGRLTNRVRVQAEAARERERRTQTLLGLSRDLAAARSTEEVISATTRHIADVLETRTVVYLPDADGHLIAHGEGAAGDAREIGVAQWVQEHGQIAGAGTGTLPAAAGVYLPLKASQRSIGVLGLLLRKTNGSNEGLRPQQRQMIEAFASQAAVALERAALAEEARQAWERVEAEFLRNTLLSGVSHDLRTPLASITGAVTSLTEAGHLLPPDAQREMLETIHSEADRMERLVNNLLDMTRLESGGLVLKKEWLPPAEVIGSALHHLDRQLHGRPVQVDLPQDLPLVLMDGVAIEQVLVNLLQNALEYTPAGSSIEMRAAYENKELLVEVADHGPGMPAGTEKRVFEKFFRAPADGKVRAGVGLGLAICRGIIEAHGGRISAANRAEGGAVFRFTLPQKTAAPVVDSAQ